MAPHGTVSVCDHLLSVTALKKWKLAQAMSGYSAVSGLVRLILLLAAQRHSPVIRGKEGTITLRGAPEYILLHQSISRLGTVGLTFDHSN